MGFIDDLKKTAADAQRAIERQVDKMQADPSGAPQPPPVDGVVPSGSQEPPPATGAPPTPSHPLPAEPQIRAVEETLHGSSGQAQANPLPLPEPPAQ